MARAIMARAPAAAARHSDERAIRLYLDMLAAERGAGSNTLAAYERDLQDLATHLKRVRRSIAAARTADLRAYLEELSRRGLQAATAARRLSAIRQLYRFLYMEGHRKDDPAAVLEGPKRQRALPRFSRSPKSIACYARRVNVTRRRRRGCAYARRGSPASLRSCMRRDCGPPSSLRCRSPPRAVRLKSLWCAARETRNVWCR